MFIKKSSDYGKAPAIILDNPKYARNVSAIARLASGFGFDQVWYSGNRVALELEGLDRLPREERMKGYGDVELINTDYPFDAYASQQATFVGVDLLPGAIPIHDFVASKNMVYIFGPEDGSIRKTFRSYCHYMVYIPTKHCLNLATTVSAMMLHRMLWTEEHYDLEEPRGFGNFSLVGQDGLYVDEVG